jgi:hypothetical protein
MAKTFPGWRIAISFEAMNSEIRMHDIVALLEDLPAQHFLTGAPLTLRRGQIGTVVMTYDGSTFEVEFSDAQGRAFAMLPIPSDKLIRLHDAPVTVAA